MWAEARLARLLPRELQARLLGGWFWSLAGAIASQAGVLAGSILVARVLGAEQYGRFALLQSTVVMLGVLAGLGLGVTTTRAVAALRDTRPEDAGRMIGFALSLSAASGTALSIAIYGSASWFSAAVFGSPALEAELRLASLLVLANTIAATQNAALTGFEAFRSLAGTGLVRGSASPVLVLAGTLAYGLRGAIGGLAAGTLAQAAWNQVLIHRHCKRLGVRLKVRPAAGEIGALWRTSLPALLSSAIVVPAGWIANVLLSRTAGGFVEVAVFSVANHWRTGIQFVPTLLSQVSLPMLSSLHHRREVSGYRAVLRTGLLLVAGMTGCAAVLVSLGSPLIMRAYGPEYVRGVPVLIALSAAAIAGASCQVAGNAIASAGRMWWGLAFNVVWVLTLLVSAWTLAPAWGARGVACAVLAAYLVHGGLMLTYTRRARVFADALQEPARQGVEPLITIVVPTRNAGATLDACLASLRSNLEEADPGLYDVLVCDGQSTDDTLGVLARHGFADRVICPPPRGISDAFNCGVEAVRTKYTIFLNADDEWGPGWLAGVTRAVLDAERRRPGEHIVVYTAVEFIDARGESLFRRYPPRYASWIHRRQSVILHPNAVYPTELLRKHPFQVFTPPRPSDQDQVFRLMREARPVRVRDVDYRFRIWGRSDTIQRADGVPAGRRSLCALLCRLYIHCYETRLLHRLRLRIVEGRTYWMTAPEDGHGD